MNVLEKILEEIEDHAIEFESFGMCDDYVSVGWASVLIWAMFRSAENAAEENFICKDMKMGRKMTVGFR